MVTVAVLIVREAGAEPFEELPSRVSVVVGNCVPGTRITPEGPGANTPVELRITLPVKTGAGGGGGGSGIGTSKPPTYIRPPLKSPPPGPPKGLNPPGTLPANETEAPAKARTPPEAMVLVMPVNEMEVPAR